MQTFDLACVGYKGAVALERLLRSGCLPANVQSYRQKGDLSNSFAAIESLCRKASIPLRIGSQLVESSAPSDLTFFVGWQYLDRGRRDGRIVIHDSLLPKYRGFAPTVAALMNGDTSIGCTALLPVDETDAGPVLLQKSEVISEGASIRSALDIQGRLSAELIVEIVSLGKGALEAKGQDHANATISLWRDDQDYRVDWTQPAIDVVRHIRASGFPYAGAQTTLNQVRVLILEAAIADEIRLAAPGPGKIFHLAGRKPLVSCGTGAVELIRITYEDGAEVAFSGRQRFQ